jgi:hypothetical protein
MPNAMMKVNKPKSSTSAKSRVGTCRRPALVPTALARMFVYGATIETVTTVI